MDGEAVRSQVKTLSMQANIWVVTMTLIQSACSHQRSDCRQGTGHPTIYLIQQMIFQCLPSSSESKRKTAFEIKHSNLRSLDWICNQECQGHQQWRSLLPWYSDKNHTLVKRRSDKCRSLESSSKQKKSLWKSWSQSKAILPSKSL